MYVLSLLEHRLYLPNAFCMIGLIVFLNSRCSFPDFNIFRWAVISVLLLMSAFTICRLKDFKDAETFWAKAVEQAPSSDMAQLNYGAALLAENRLEEGRVHIEKSLELNPSRSNGHLTLAKYFERKKAIEEAKQEYLKEIELFPGNIGAFFALSSMYREMGLQAESEYWMRKGYDRANDIKGQTGL
jgi:tetratricopeptide (TPR) repeat protein